MRGRKPIDYRRWLQDHASCGGDDCLIWPFGRSHYGYGQFEEAGRYLRPHRVMCEIVHGPEPFPKAHARHLCSNGHLGCVNPKHIAWGTAQENSADMVAAGRATGRPRKPKPCRDCGATIQDRSSNFCPSCREARGLPVPVPPSRGPRAGVVRP